MKKLTFLFVIVLFLSSCGTMEYPIELEYFVKDSLISYHNKKIKPSKAEVYNWMSPFITYAMGTNSKRNNIALDDTELTLLLVAMTIQESGHLMSFLVGSNNLLGIKKLKNALPNYMSTQEYDANNKKYSKLANFSAFKSFGDCYSQWISLINEKKCYIGFRESKNLGNAVLELGKYYATDPDYSENIQSIIKELINIKNLNTEL